MLKRFLLCFALLCLCLVAAFYICFQVLLIPRYQNLIHAEAQTSINLLQYTLQNTVIRTMEAVNAEVVKNNYEGSSLSDLSRYDKLSLSNALQEFHFISDKKNQFGLFYTMDIYLDRSHTVLSTTMGFQQVDDFQDNERFPWLTEDLFERYPIGKWFVNEYNLYSGQNSMDIISFSQVLMLLSTEEEPFPCVLNYGIKRSTLLELLNISNEELNGPIFITDTFRNTVALGAPIENPPIGWDGLSATGNFLEIESGDSVYQLCISDQSDPFGMLRMIPVANIKQGSNELNRLFYFALLVILLISILFGYFMSLRLYRPIKELISNMQRKYTEENLILEGAGRCNSEWDFISNTVQQLSHKIDSLEKALSENTAIARNHFIIRLLIGTVSLTENLDHRLNSYGVHFDFPVFSVLTIHMHQRVFQNMEFKERQLIRVGLLSSLTQYQNQQCIIYGVEEDEYLISAILNYSDKIRIHALIVDILKHVFINGSSIAGTFSVAVGHFVSNLLELPKSRQTSLIAANYVFLYPQQELFFYDLLNEGDRAKVPEKMAADSLAALKNENIEAFLQAVLELLREIRHCMFTHESVHVLLSSLTRQSLQLPHFSPKKECQNFSFENIDDFEDAIAEELKSIQNQDNYLRDNKKTVLVQSAQSFIDRNLNQPLSLSDVAKQVYISPAYLSRLFKELLGINYNEYVNNRRMEAARKELLSTQKSVDEIACQVGFSGANYFIRKFKQFYGVTPVVYRMRNIAKSKDEQ